MLEKHLIEHCSPTLASLKTASLFNYAYSCDKLFKNSLDDLNRELHGKGVELIVLRKINNKALIYVCRKEKLGQDLNRPGVARFLKGCGYNDTDTEYALNKLKKRLSEKDAFPHEIGLFLGYPLGDVIGFIYNSGQNSKCTGCWKVYCNECEAIRTFAKFNKCKDVYIRLWNQGRSVLQLTVAA